MLPFLLLRSHSLSNVSTQNPLPFATPFALFATLLYATLLRSTPILTHIYGSLPPCSKQHGPLKILTQTYTATYPFPLTYKKTSRGIFPYGPPPQKVCRHILFNSATVSGLHPTPPHPQNSFPTHPNRPLLFPSPSSLPFSSPPPHSPAQTKAGLHTVQARFLSLLSLLCRYDNGFTDT